MNHYRHALNLSVAAFAMSNLVACTTPYQRPEMLVPSAFAHADTHADSAQTQTAQAMPDRWWETFNDPQLNALVAQVLANNNDLAVAGLRLYQAGLRSGINRLNQFPKPSGNVSANVPEGASNTFSATLSASYETDLWGRLASTTRAAEWEASASVEDRESTALTLVASACEYYWRIAYTRQQIDYREQGLAYQRRVLNLVQIQKSAGSVSGLEVAEAEQNVQTQFANLAALRQQLIEYRAALALLMNGQAWPQARELAALPDQVLPQVAAGLPADILSRRPDVKAAELRLRSTLASYDATRSSFYPSLTLTGSLGGTSLQLKNVLQNPAATLLANLSLPFLNYPQNRLNTDLAKKDYDIASINFRQTLLRAFSDADNALSKRQQFDERSRALYLTVEAAQKVEALYAIRYRAGKVALRVWLDAQESLRNARLNYDDNRLSLLLNQTALYRALGGRTEPQ